MKANLGGIQEGNNAAGSLRVHYLIPFKVLKLARLLHCIACRVDSDSGMALLCAYRDVVTGDPGVSERKKHMRQNEKIDREKRAKLILSITSQVLNGLGTLLAYGAAGFNSAVVSAAQD